MQDNELLEGVQDMFEVRIYLATYEAHLKADPSGSTSDEQAHDAAVVAIKRWRFTKHKLASCKEIPREITASWHGLSTG